jgi:hypothetical protein
MFRIRIRIPNADPDPAADEISSKSQNNSHHLELFDKFEKNVILLIKILEFKYKKLTLNLFTSTYANTYSILSRHGSGFSF